MPLSDPTSDAGPTALVVGAGPVGLLLASELIRHGLTCRVVDPKHGPTDESRAMGVHARTLELLDALGEADRFVELGRPLLGIVLHHPDGRPAITVDLSDSLRALGTPFPFILSLPQGKTERLLGDRLNRLGGSVEWGTRLSGLSQDADGVTATLEGAPDGPETARFDWLVGCDGAHSDTRHALGLSFAGDAYEEAFNLADISVDWDLPADHGHILSPPNGPLLALPFPESGRWRLIDLSGTEIAPGADVAVARFREALGRAGFPTATLSEATWSSSFRVQRRVTDRFREGRCFVAGDAAHVHSPAGGQGMNTGLQDAMNLAWKLGLVARGRASSALLDSYEAERRPVVAGVLRRTDRLTRLVTLRNPLARAARDAVLGIVSGLGFVRRRAASELSQLGVSYERGPIVSEDVPHDLPGPRAGDRAPDIMLGPADGGPSRFYSALRGTGHSLWLFGDDAPLDAPLFRAAAMLIDRDEAAVVRYVSRAPRSDLPAGVNHWPDADGRLREALGGGAPGLVLVRPDAYIGYRASPPAPEKFAAQLSRVFGPKKGA